MRPSIESIALRRNSVESITIKRKPRAVSSFLKKTFELLNVKIHLFRMYKIMKL
jgi:hypothetical protein